MLAHVKQKLCSEEKRRAELQADLAVAQQQLQERKEQLRLSKRRREKRKLRNIKLQEAQLLEDPTLLAHFQVACTLPHVSQCMQNLCKGDRWRGAEAREDCSVSHPRRYSGIALVGRRNFCS